MGHHPKPPHHQTTNPNRKLTFGLVAYEGLQGPSKWCPPINCTHLIALVGCLTPRNGVCEEGWMHFPPYPNMVVSLVTKRAPPKNGCFPCWPPLKPRYFSNTHIHLESMPQLEEASGAGAYWAWLASPLGDPSTRMMRTRARRRQGRCDARVMSSPERVHPTCG